MRRIPITDLEGDVVEKTVYYQPVPKGSGGVTTIFFRSRCVLYITDLPGRQQVEAYAP